MNYYEIEEFPKQSNYKPNFPNIIWYLGVFPGEFGLAGRGRPCYHHTPHVLLSPLPLKSHLK